jgi:predicted RNase H-related nuclease YkuK (DUF458 family)
MKGICAIIIMAVLPVVTLAQPDSLWSRTFGGTDLDICESLQQTSDGGYLLGGETFFGAGDWDFWLVKTDANGNRVWDRIFGGSSTEVCRSVQQTSNGGYVLGGYTGSFGAGSADFWLVKTDSNGYSVWSRTFGGSASDACYSVQETTDGGFILGGYTTSFGAGGLDFWLVKTNSNGDSLWSRTFGGVATDHCYSVQQTTDGGYILAGDTYSFGAGQSDFLLVKTDGNGNRLWSRTLGGSGHDGCNAVRQTTDGGYIIGGSTSSSGAGSGDFWLVKMDSNGYSVWSHTFGGSASDACHSVQETTDGGFILGGYTESYGAGESDFWLVKTNANGDSLWSRTFGGTDNDRCESIQQTTDGGYVLGGYTESYGAGGSDFWLVKTGPDPLAVESEIHRLPAEYVLHPNFPNPFNSITTIPYDVERFSRVQLIIFNLLGAHMATLVNSRHAPGSYTISWDAKDLPSGIYLYHMKAEGFAQTRKLVLIK